MSPPVPGSASGQAWLVIRSDQSLHSTGSSLLPGLINHKIYLWENVLPHKFHVEKWDLRLDQMCRVLASWQHCWCKLDHKETPLCTLSLNYPVWSRTILTKCIEIIKITNAPSEAIAIISGSAASPQSVRALYSDKKSFHSSSKLPKRVEIFP